MLSQVCLLVDIRFRGDLIDHVLYQVGVFRIQFQRQVEVLQGHGRVLQLLVDLASQDMNGCLFGAKQLQLLKYFQSVLVAVQRKEHIGLLILAEWVVLVQTLRFVEIVQRLRLFVLSMRRHSQVHEKYGRPRVQLHGQCEILLGIHKLLLFKEDVAKAPVCVVVVLVSFNRQLVAFTGSFKVLVLNVLMPTESVSVGKLWVQLDGTL